MTLIHEYGIWQSYIACKLFKCHMEIIVGNQTRQLMTYTTLVEVLWLSESIR